MLSFLLYADELDAMKKLERGEREANKKENKIDNETEEKGSEQIGDTDSYVEKINKTTHEKKVSNLNKEDHSNYLKYLP